METECEVVLRILSDLGETNNTGLCTMYAGKALSAIGPGSSAYVGIVNFFKFSYL